MFKISEKLSDPQELFIFLTIKENKFSLGLNI